MLLGPGTENIATEKTILIMPAICVGNVGQLAVDLLITNLGLKYFGRVSGHDCVFPTVGADPFDAADLCTSFMAYRSDDCQLLVFQQRSDFLREKKKEYLERLVSWLKTCKFRAIFVLTSAFAYERTDAEMALNPLQYRTTSAAEKFLTDSKIKVDNCGALKMPWTIPTGSHNLETEANQRALPGSGIAQALFKKCSESDLPLIVISKYCMEGDNRMDSCQMASTCACLLGLPEIPKKWAVPKSWRTEDAV